MKRVPRAGRGLAAIICGSAVACTAPPPPQESARPQAVIPRTWDDRVMAELEVPLAHAEYSPKHTSADYYYRQPVRPIYKSYAVYHVDREPPGYLDSLRRMEPQLAWDKPALNTSDDWIRAGEIVFDAGFISAIGIREDLTQLYFRDRGWLERVRPPVSADGIITGYRYVVREKGKIEVSTLSCATCHTRVMPDGTILKGAQGNFPFDRAFAEDFRQETAATAPLQRTLLRQLYLTPWARAPLERLDRAKTDLLAAQFAGQPGGALTRHRSTLGLPIQVPDLIGVARRKYLDRTGLQIHRDIADLMRYAALNQGGDDLASFGTFVPAAEFAPVPPAEKNENGRYSDEQLYSLARYLYSLKPPRNPNAADTTAVTGQKVFEREHCGGCHTPPLYTNNKLTPAIGFAVPPEHRNKYDILPIVVGTDPRLTLETRRGTGYYKVPSLLGVWYRGPFEHNGSVATLEDWFDPRRLRDDYVPTGWKGPPGTRTRAVKGHQFGLHTSETDRTALIAFLRTLN